MAKWGEGDPRWIVEERPDATNVNNWHWTEKNATHWSKDRFQQLFNNLKIDGNGFECFVERVDKSTGEATVNNRKGKLIFFYDWEVVLKWSGTMLARSKNVHKGKLTIPNLSEENDLDEIEITVTIDESNDESETIKQFMYNVGRDVVRKQLGLYIKELKEEYSKNLILPKKGETESNATTNATTNAKNVNFIEANAFKNAQVQSDNSNGTCAMSSKTVGCKIDVKTLNMTIEFHCSANDIYNALTKTEMVSAFTGGPVKMEPIRGGEFNLYGGNVEGKFEELVPFKTIKQTWRLKNWPSGHYSNVSIDIQETSNITILRMRQTGIPASEYDQMKVNWLRYYWNSIKQTFYFDVSLSIQ